MNPEINLNDFGGASSVGATPVSGKKLVSPPQRVFTRYLLPLLLLSAFAASGVYVFRDSLTKKIPVAITLPIPAREGVGIAVVNDNPSDSVEGKGAALFQAPGWIEPEPFPTMISSLRMGTVQTIDVIEGQKVSSGTLIARLISDDASLAVEMASSTLALKRAKLNAAQERWGNPTDLEESVATALATQDKLQAEARRLSELLELARVEANIGNQLRSGGYEASLETLRKQTQLSASRNQLAETQAEISLTSATIAAAKERLRLRIEDKESLETSQAEVAEAEAALATAQLQLQRSEIVAPTNGLIMRINSSPGSMVSPEMADGMLIASMYQPDKIQVRVDVPLSEAAKVKTGLTATIKVEAMPDKTFTGTLTNIVPEFDLQKNVLPVKVHIENPVEELRPEMIARVEFFPEPKKPAPIKITADNSGDSATTASKQFTSGSFLLPDNVASGKGNNAMVLVAGPDGVAHSRKVTIQPSSQTGYVLVTQGLQLSDKVISAPDKSVSDGSPIFIKGMVNHGSD